MICMHGMHGRGVTQKHSRISHVERCKTYFVSGPLSCHNGHNGKMHYSVGYGIAVQFPFNGQFEFVKITLGYLEVLQKMVRLFNLNPYCPVAALEGR